MIAILDYGSGNIRSAQRACETTGHRVIVTSDLEVATDAAGLVVPGVGAFSACMDALRKVGGDEVIATRINKKLPILGICVGMQILFEASTEGQQEGEKVEGLRVFSGIVERLAHSILPQIGWNTVEAPDSSMLFEGIHNERFYFVHSYAVKAMPSLGKVTQSFYGENFIAAYEKENISAVQFHPEKSGQAGLTLISNWAKTL